MIYCSQIQGMRHISENLDFLIDSLSPDRHSPSRMQLLFCLLHPPVRTDCHSSRPAAPTEVVVSQVLLVNEIPQVDDQ